MLHPDKDFSTLVQALTERFKNRMKHEKAFFRLTTIRQGDKSIREFNQEFRTVLMNLDQRPKEETLMWYYKVAIGWKLAKSLAEVSPQSVEEAMQRVEDKKQEKTIHEVVYGEKKRPQDKREAGYKTNKEPVVCDYCEKPNYSVIECRKRMA
jgi:Retrotransposon gag protein